MKVHMSLIEKEQVEEFMTPSEFMNIFKILYTSSIAVAVNPSKEIDSDRPRKQT